MVHTYTRRITRLSLLVAVTALMSQIALPLPFSPVPLTLSVAAVFLCGLLLPPRQAAACQLCYLLLGALGAPVFAQFNAGLPALLGPTGGYLMAYPLMAGAVSICTRLGTTKGESKLRWAIAFLTGELLALLICYTLGTLWLAKALDISLNAALKVAVLPYIIPDLIKAGFVLSFGRVLQRRIWLTLN